MAMALVNIGHRVSFIEYNGFKLSTNTGLSLESLISYSIENREEIQPGLFVYKQINKCNDNTVSYKDFTTLLLHVLNIQDEEIIFICNLPQQYEVICGLDNKKVIYDLMDNDLLRSSTSYIEHEYLLMNTADAILTSRSMEYLHYSFGRDNVFC